jgi:hypothetical protein
MWTVLVLVPLLCAAAAWALQMATAFCNVEPPPFWHALLMVVAMGVANAVVFHAMGTVDSMPGFWARYLTPVVTSAVVIAITAPTHLLTAVGVSVMHLLFCGLIYFGLDAMIEAISAGPLFAAGA